MAFHTRSNSFPSRPHPIVQEVDEHLCRLRTSEATFSSSSSISQNLSSLQDIYECVDRLLQLSQTQQALAQEQNEESTNELLDGSLRILDVCSIAKDALSQTKECVKDLQSIMRRRRGCESSEVRKYLTSRKIVKRTIHKVIANLKQSTFSSLNKDSEIVNKLREVDTATITVLESLLSFIAGPKSKSLVSKLMQSRRVSCEEEAEANEFAQVDFALNSSKFDNGQSQLDKLESCIEDQEEVVDRLFRQLIKTRVSLLNILNH